MTEFDLGDVDPLLFFQLMIDGEAAVLDNVTLTGSMPGMMDMMDGIADIAHEHLADAVAELDRLIEADPTWRPA